MSKKQKMILLSPLFLAAFALFVALGGEIVRLLWNYALPPLFGWREITFWQALALLALCRILFGSLGGHGAGNSKIGRRMADRRGAMSPEERERWRHNLRDRFGCGPEPTAPPAPGSPE